MDDRMKEVIKSLAYYEMYSVWLEHQVRLKGDEITYKAVFEQLGIWLKQKLEGK